MGCTYQRGRVWWIKYRGTTGEAQYEATPARTRAEAKPLLREIEERVYRQVRGLLPLTMNPEGWTVAGLMRWWLETYSSQCKSHAKNEGTIRAHLLSSKISTRRLEEVGPGDVEALLAEKDRELAPESVNHIRGFLVRAFNKAR